jgi:hypothetical protein
MMQQQPQAQAAALAVAPTVPHPNDPAGGDAPPKQVAQAMERLGRAGRLIADIRLGADRLLEALFVAGGAPSYSAPQHIDRTARAIVLEEAAMRRHFQDLRALGRYHASASPPALIPPFSLPSRVSIREVMDSLPGFHTELGCFTDFSILEYQISN